MNVVKKLMIATALLSVASLANATPATWVDNIDFNPDIYVKQYSSFPYIHNINDNGFNPGTDSISSYSLNINLFDDSSSWTDGWETASIDLPGVTGDQWYFDLSGTESGGWSLAGQAQLQDFGLLSVTISSWLGDFMIGSSTLTAHGSAGSAVSVPEPGSLALMGLGLLGVALWSRRKTAV